MIHKDYCSRCKIKAVPLIKRSKSKTTQYYICRDCNNKQAREYYKTTIGRDNIKKALYKQYSNNKPKIIARVTVYKAIKNGKLIRPELCTKCNSPGRIEAHHHNYKNKLDVQWLCTSCHADLERVL